MALNNLGGLSLSLNQHARAESLFTRALRIAETSLGSDHPRVAASLGGLADVHRLRDEFGRADSLYSRALVRDPADACVRIQAAGSNLGAEKGRRNPSWRRWQARTGRTQKGFGDPQGLGGPAARKGRD